MAITCSQPVTVIPFLLTLEECCFTKADMDTKLSRMNELILKWSAGIGIFAGALVGVIGLIFGVLAGTGVSLLLPGVGTIAAALAAAGLATGFFATIIATMIVSGGISLAVLFLLKALCVSIGTCSCVESKGMCLTTYTTRILWFWVEVPFWLPLPSRCSTIEPNCP